MSKKESKYTVIWNQCNAMNTMSESHQNAYQNTIDLFYFMSTTIRYNADAFFDAIKMSYFIAILLLKYCPFKLIQEFISKMICDINNNISFLD